MIQNKSIPQGYKDSPLGLIPMEWEVKKFGEILLEARLGGNYENSESNKGIPVIKMGNLERGTINLEKIQCLPENESYNEHDILQDNDLLFNTRNTLELVGKVAIWKNQLPLAVYNSNLLRMTFKSNYVESNIFMNYAFNSHYILNQLRSIATGTTSVAAIYGRDLDTIKFFIPPLPEQQKIAEILSVWDEAIEKQTRLIEKIEIRKRGLMQQLLTGKKRIHELTRKIISENSCNSWTEKKLRDIAIIKKGIQVNKLDLQNEGLYPTVNGGIEPSGYSNDYNTEANTITISEGGNSCGFVNLITTKFWSGGHCYTIAETGTMNKYFLFQLLKFNEENIMSLRVGSGLPNIQVKSLINFTIQIPPIVEQTAIANILSSADSEINLAKQKLTRLKEQKKGLMQKLLTGRKRVAF